MIIESPVNQYDCIGTVFQNQTNDSYICVKNNDVNRTRYVLNMIKDRRIAKRFLTTVQETENAKDCIECFTWNENLCVVMPYYETRPLVKFFKTYDRTSKEWMEVFKRIVLCCMTAKIPVQLLYMVIRQFKFNLTEADEVNIDYCIDFGGYDTRVSQSDCIRECVSLAILLYDEIQDDEYALYQVLYKKYMRNNYDSFISLYKDLENTDFRLRKYSIGLRLEYFWLRNKGRLWIFIETILFIMGIFAIILFVSQFLFGELPLMRIFENTFMVIGDRKLYR